MDPADPTKAHSSSSPLPTKDVKSFKAECGQKYEAIWLKYDVNGSVPNAAVAATSPDNQFG